MGSAQPACFQDCGRAGVCELLVCCRQTLAPCSELLLELAFTLAADSWPAVAAPPRAWLARVQG